MVSVFFVCIFEARQEKKKTIKFMKHPNLFVVEMQVDKTLKWALGGKIKL